MGVRRDAHARRAIAGAALLSLASFSASAGLGVSAPPSGAPTAGGAPSAVCTSPRPTTLDYMVLANMAESSQLLGMTGYRPSRPDGALEKSVRFEEVKSLML
jgi:hypothetical protein